MIKVELRGAYGKAIRDINKMLDKAVINFIHVGEECVKHAKDNGTYQNWTQNLRNSIGYVVLKNGVVQQRANITDLNETITEELIAEYQSGIVLIVVAGMNYAAHVEAKNYDVLSSAELLAKRLVPKFLKKLGLE